MLIAIATVVFLLLRATPGDPADAILGTSQKQPKPRYDRNWD